MGQIATKKIVEKLVGLQVGMKCQELASQFVITFGNENQLR